MNGKGENAMETRVRAYAKINLTLDILGTLPEGYHEVEMIMQQVSLFDGVFLRTAEGGGITVKSNCEWLPCDERNLAWKAVKVFSQETGTPEDVFIEIKKYIPVAAGLAGGSSDAAAVLIGLDRLYGTKLTRDALCRMGSKIGSDVPFCVRGRTMLSKGRGEILSPLPSMPDCHILLAKPRLNVSTPTAYRRFDEAESVTHPDTAACIGALQAGDLDELAAHVHNVFEDVLPLHDVDKLKQIMLSHGAVTAAMSGSGPTVFGLFRNEADAFAAKQKCRPFAPFTFCCKPIR